MQSRCEFKIPVHRLTLYILFGPWVPLGHLITGRGAEGQETDGSFLLFPALVLELHSSLFFSSFFEDIEKLGESTDA